jgi:N-succinyldiaminopimelate aminotransferase
VSHRDLAARLQPFGTTIFATMGAQALKFDAVNLGQGFPDEDGPLSIREEAARATIDGRGNQYPPGSGVASLRQEIAAHKHSQYGLTYDPDTQLIVTCGATEGIAACVLGLTEPGDEVLLLEPFYDSYAATIAMAGGVRVPVPLTADTFSIDGDALRAAITPRSRLLIVNNPHNPTGHVLSTAERRAIATLAAEFDLIVISDEVYEHLTFTEAHRPLALEPELRDRTLTLSSAGKIFSLTGWKIGWVAGPADLVRAALGAKQWLTYACAGPLQHAVAYGLGHEVGANRFTGQLARSLRDRATHLNAGLVELGFDVHEPAAGYFTVVDTRAFLAAGRWPGRATTAAELAHELPALAGVVAIPVAPLCDNPTTGEHLLRFAFCKRHEVIDEALLRLGATLI